MAKYLANVATAGLRKGQVFGDDEAPLNIDGLIQRGLVIVLELDPESIIYETEPERNGDYRPWGYGSDLEVADVWGVEEAPSLPVDDQPDDSGSSDGNRNVTDEEATGDDEGSPTLF